MACIKVAMHTGVHLSPDIEQVHRAVDLLTAADNNVLKVLQPRRQIPIDEIVQPLINRRVFFRVQPAVIAGHAFTCSIAFSRFAIWIVGWMRPEIASPLLNT